MTENKLKTLKDINCYEDEYISNLVDKNMLKAEAVKWYKAQAGTYDIIAEWIKHFFNITEEELK